MRERFLEISPFQSDEGELIGKTPQRRAFRFSLPEIQGAESSQGHSGDSVSTAAVETHRRFASA